MNFYFVIANSSLSVFKNDVKSKKKQYKKKHYKKLKSIENSISPSDPCIKYFGAQVLQFLKLSKNISISFNSTNEHSETEPNFI